jgi:hypothetical protein
MGEIEYFIGASSLFLIFAPGFIICIVHTVWIDYTKHRNHLIELSFGVDSIYMKERLDYAAALSLSMAPHHAYTIRYKKDILKSPKRCEFIPTPVLHLNKNYLKLLEEFPLYSKFYTACYVLMIFGAVMIGCCMWSINTFNQNLVANLLPQFLG